MENSTNDRLIKLIDYKLILYKHHIINNNIKFYPFTTIKTILNTNLYTYMYESDPIQINNINNVLNFNNNLNGNLNGNNNNQNVKMIIC